MPTRKIADPPESKPCYSPEHSPPSMMVFAPGTYEHTCPSCGKVTIFTVAAGYCESQRRTSYQPSNVFELVSREERRRLANWARRFS